MRIKTILLLMLLVTCQVWANDGDVFHVESIEGHDIAYMIISETEKTCQVGSGGAAYTYKDFIENSSLTIPEVANGYSVIGIGSYAFSMTSGNYANDYIESISIPSSVTYIGAHAFDKCHKISMIDISNVRRIGDFAFYGCSSLASVTFSDNLESIGNSSFSSCKKLKEIKLSDSVMSIGNDAFAACEMLSEVVLSNSLTTIKEYTFSECAIKSIDIPNSVESIGSFAFSRCPNLESLDIPESVTSIGTGAFYGSGLKSIKLPNSLKSIKESTFYECSQLSSIVIPNTVTQIGNTVFRYCSSLSEIQLPSSLLTIGSHTFADCIALTSITIPQKVNRIGNYCFSGCDNMTYVISKMQEPCFLEGYFYGNTKPDATLQVPHGTLEAYKKSEWGNIFFKIVEAPIVFQLSLNSKGNGVITYLENTIYNTSGIFDIDEGASATIFIIPDKGYRIASLKINGTDVTSSITNNQYTISSVSANTSVEVVFEAIPPTTYTLSVKSSGSGSVTYGTTTIKNQTKSFTVEEGTSATMSFSPDAGYRIASVKVDGTDVTSSVTDNQLILNNVKENLVIDVSFGDLSVGDLFYAKTVEGVLMTFKVTDAVNKTCQVGNGTNPAIDVSTTGTVTIPSEVNGYKVNEIGKKAFWNSYFYVNRFILPEGIISIGNWAFYQESSLLETINIPSSVQRVGDRAFANCNHLKYVYINDLKSWCNISFEGVWSNPICYAGCLYINNQLITNLQIPEGVTKLNSNAFIYYKLLNTVTLPSTLASIGASAFSYCENLSTVVSNIISPYSISDDVFREISSDCILYVPKGTKSKYEEYSGWTQHFKEIIEEKEYCNLTIISSGNGSVTYGTTTIKNQTKSFTVEEGTSATLSFAPDAGYRITSVKVNGTDVTSSVSDNQYTISGISANTSIEVVFDAIPPTTYTLSIKSSGSGYVLYNSTTVREKTSTFTVTGGTSAQISLVPDEGYRVANVKVNNVDVTGGVSNNRYVISSITENTNMEVVFEAIPPTTYSLSIKALGNGTVMYGNVTLKNQTQSFTVTDGSYATLTITPENGYRIKHIFVNNQNVTSNISNNQYTVSSIHANTTVEVEFEEIPVITYTLTVKAIGNGNIYYNNVTIKNQSKQYTVNEGASVTITFSPDNGNSVKSVKVNGNDVTSKITGNRYFIERMIVNTSVEVTFVEDVNALTVEGINYTVISQSQKTIKLAGGNIGQVLTVPASITQNGTKWTITGIDNNALVNNAELAAIIWNPSVPFTAEVNNPNLLLYVTDEQYAPTSIKNVIVNGIASNITLVDAASGNDFYCPQAFTAQKISYTHNYNMMTGLGESRGWETISLPFDVQTITHASKGNIVPFANWKNGDTTKPFWLYELTGSGFVEANGIKAYTPYIISLPNNPQYDEQWRLNGTVTFSASSVTIGKTEDVKTTSYQDRTFVPTCTGRDANEGFYALNAVNDYTVNNSGMTEGSRFVLNMRHIHPFEAYMTSTSNSRMFIDIFEGMTTDIRQIQMLDNFDNQPVYNLQGQRIQVLKKGVYIKNGQKFIKK